MKRKKQVRTKTPYGSSPITKAQLRKERLMVFREEILPLLLKQYDVQEHGPNNAPSTMYKIIITGNKSYDYYPMAEKIRKNNHDGTYQWKSMTIQELKDKLINIV